MNYFRPHQYFLFVLYSFATLLSSMGFITAQTTNMTVHKIWNQAPHSAFTDLLWHKGKFYCTFREGSGHVPGEHGEDGTIRVITSKDGVHWSSLALLKKEIYDLRDPKISVAPNGNVMVIMGATDYDGKVAKGLMPHVSFSDKKGMAFSEPQPISIDKSIQSNWDWLWRVTWHKETGYGIVYQSPRNMPSTISLLKTEDGIHYTVVKQFEDIKDSPNEATIRFMPDDEMMIFLRREKGNKNGLIGKGYPPYDDNWDWKELEIRLGGPNFIRLPYKQEALIYATRVYHPEGSYTGVFKGNDQGPKEELIRLPSGGDTSYPGIVFRKKSLYVSYYSSHEGKTSIYLAKISGKWLKERMKEK